MQHERLALVRLPEYVAITNNLSRKRHNHMKKRAYLRCRTVRTSWNIDNLDGNTTWVRVHRLSLLETHRFARRVVANILVFCALFTPSQLFSLDEPLPLLSSFEPAVSGRAVTFDLLLERAISQRLITGGVIVTGNREGILSTVAKGQVSPEPGSPLLGEHTVFDVASLTKVVATAPAVMKLLDQGLINLSDPLSRWFPEFTQADHEEITILNLLTHTSGLTDFPVSRKQTTKRAIRKAAAQRYWQWTGKRFDYADINFMLLGELVRRVSGETLDTFCRREIYLPLDVRATMFLPPSDLRADIAPTAGFRRGVVSDTNARRLGSVAGHAGLFSSAYDLSRFARLMLGRGMIDNKRVLSEQAVAQMTSPYLSNKGLVRRGLGWDICSPFSGWKGDFFSEASFGHAGYTGSSIWIDSQNDRFVILLTRRINYEDTRSFKQLRTDVSTIASVDLNMSKGELGLGALWELANIRARLLQAEQVILQASPANREVATQTAKKRQQIRAQRRPAKSERLLAKAGKGHRPARIAKLARAEKPGKGIRSSKKRRMWKRNAG